MKLRIKIGAIELHLEGMTLTRKQVLDMLGETAGIALALTADDATEEEPASTPLGFTAHMERSPEYVEEDLSWYFEE